MLFVPGEAFLAPALDHDPTLLEDALAKGVHIVDADDADLDAAYGRLHLAAGRARRQRRAGVQLGRELYTRLGTMGGHVDKLGRQLTGAVNAYNDTVRSLEKSVLVTARKLNELEVIEGELADPTPVEEPVRTLGATELVTSAEDGRAVVALPSRADGRHDDPFDRAEDYGIELTLDDAEQRKLS